MVAVENRADPFRILITDDDAGCRETVREALETGGYETHEAACGREAIEVARARLVHVVIVDMNMPDLDGVQTVTLIRRETAAPVPSILMSADASPDLMARAFDAHFESFMPKPVHVDMLRRIVEEIIRRTYGRAL